MKNISELPNDLLIKILSFLPTKETAATSGLSKQWRSLWKQQQDVDYVELCKKCSPYWLACITTKFLGFGDEDPSDDLRSSTKFVGMSLMLGMKRGAYLKGCAECKGSTNAPGKVTVCVLDQEAGKTHAFIWTTNQEKSKINVDYFVKGMIVAKAQQKGIFTVAN